MSQDRMRLGVIAIRRPAVTRWGPGELRPVGVLEQAPETDPGTCITVDGGTETWYLGAADMVLHPGDTGHHRDNLQSGRPSIWVAIRGQTPERAEIVCVTADPYEGEGLASDLDLKVEAVPMPGRVREFVAAFVAAHHVEIPFKKRKRLPHDPNALTARAPRILQPEEKWGASRGKR